jgi:uncharacterized protein (TIGR04255 family)
MTTRALGQMANAPLALVLAQVRFSPYLTIADAMPALQNELRRDYPVFKRNQIQALDFGAGASPPNVSVIQRFNFSDTDNREGFIVQQDSLVFLVTRYKTFDDFERKHRIILDCFERIVPDLYVERLGLRYVDVIVPRKDERPEHYLVEGLRGCAIEMEEEPTGFQSQYVATWKLKDGQMKFRFVNGLRTPPFLPPDLHPLELGVPEVIQRGADAASAGRSVGVLDFDRLKQHRGLYRSAEVSKLFSSMHNDASVAFKRSMSPLAEKVWNSN